MASSSTGNNLSNSRQLQGEQRATDLTLLASKISQLKNEIQAERVDYVKEKIMKNKEVVESVVSHHLSTNNRSHDSGNMLTLRKRFPTRIIPAKDQDSLEMDDNDNNNNEEADYYLNAKLPFVQKLPHFTTWVHTTRNQKMTDDQSVEGKQRIFYEQIGGEAMVNADDEEETVAPAEVKHEFSDGEKRIIRMVSQEYEPNEMVVQTLTRFIGGTTSEIRDEFNRLKNKNEEAINENDLSMLLDKSLASCLDSFDALFCRRCLVFDCRLHGIGQPVITPAERLEEPPLEDEADDAPCGAQCYKCSYQGSTDGANPGVSGDVITWRLLEDDLYSKGLQIFGRNSCLIARNLLPGLKTCMEIYTRMHNDEASASSTTDDYKKHDNTASSGRKGKGKKAGGHPTRWRKTTYGKHSNKQYTPCECNPICGRDCTCLHNSTCCEKYCGCSKSCKNRFKGCHCAKSQCRSPQCPCFAAGRECDPDVCKNCWVSCGGGSLSEPPRRGEGQCGNMRLLLRQQQRILLGISDVAGWGAFVKNTVEKDEYLGEYTGELISQEEADLRGQFYDRANSSFLFNLNDEYVIDALHQGNKLKFANHSANPNCHASIIKVGGDHRVGIFAKEHIAAGEEIFYDYCYEPEQSPSWARKPDDQSAGPSGPPRGRSKKPQLDDPKEGPSVPPQARPKKPQSRPKKPQARR